MPSSDAESKGRGLPVWLRRLVKGIIVIALFVAVDVLMTLVLEPYGTAAEVTWHEYRAATAAGEPIDTIVIGSSYSQRNIDPATLDAQLGSHSFSLSTPAQSLQNSLACLRTAATDHGIKRALISINTNSLQFEPWYHARVTFLQAKSLGEAPNEVLRNVSEIALDPENFGNVKSFGWALPWMYSSVGYDVQAISDNISNRMTYANPVDAAAFVDPDWTYVGQGHGIYDGTLDFERIPADAGYAYLSTEPLLERNMAELAALCDYAKQQGIELYVVNSPRPRYAYAQHAEDNYPDLLAQLEGLVREHGATYYDMNLAREAFYRVQPEEFIDSEHLNIAGSEHLSAALGELITASEAGEDVSGWFYGLDEWDEFIADHDTIELAWFYSTVTQDRQHIDFTAGALTIPSGLELEYQYSIEDYKNGHFYVVRPYSSDPTYRYQCHGYRDDVTVRVSVRVVGSTEQEPVSHIATVFY